jgi:hypothetical protein
MSLSKGPAKFGGSGSLTQPAGSYLEPLPCRCCTRTSADVHCSDAGSLGQLTDGPLLCTQRHPMPCLWSTVSAFNGGGINKDIKLAFASSSLETNNYNLQHCCAPPGNQILINVNVKPIQWHLLHRSP